jgi:DUF2075 family protein
MTGFRIEKLRLDERSVEAWSRVDPRFTNWPVVYALSGGRSVYVGESLHAANRFQQHLKSPERRSLSEARVVIDHRFNKSACLDLESFLIRLFAGDGQLTVLNRNEGITDADYFDRASYHATFERIFEELREAGMFSRSIPEIENDVLFKLSPFKALSTDQAAVVENLLEGLFADIESASRSLAVVQGDPGTGKTIVAIYLMKLLSDIQASDAADAIDVDSMFADFFQPGHPELLRDFRVGLVVPQQALRKSVQRVFGRTPGLDPSQVLSPFQVGQSEQPFDLLLVDEAHRLGQRAAQASAVLNLQFADINTRLFGKDDHDLTQLDWIERQSSHQILLVDQLQSVKPADLPTAVLGDVLRRAETDDRYYRLFAQHRVRAGSDYVAYVRAVLRGESPSRPDFGEYDLRFFDDLGTMRDEIRRLDESVGLARLLAGYAWPWRSRRDRDAYDIEIDGVQLRWNTRIVDWVNSPTSIDEVGSIHTIQGYDLNYAGVIIGPDLRHDPDTGRIVFDRPSYHDVNGKKNNPMRGITYSDDDLLQYVRNIYSVLLTRGIRGTFVYVHDPALREHLRSALGFAPSS